MPLLEPAPQGNTDADPIRSNVTDRARSVGLRDHRIVNVETDCALRRRPRDHSGGELPLLIRVEVTGVRRVMVSILGLPEIDAQMKARVTVQSGYGTFSVMLRPNAECGTFSGVARTTVDHTSSSRPTVEVLHGAY